MIGTTKILQHRKYSSTSRMKIKAVKPKHTIIQDPKLSRDVVLLECKCRHDYDPLFFSTLLFFLIYINLFIYLFLAALGLCCCTLAFSSCGERGLLFVAVCGLLIAVAFLVAEHGLQAHKLQQLQHVGSVVAELGLQSAGSVVVAHELSCSAACGIFLDQGWNPCPLHWQADC